MGLWAWNGRTVSGQVGRKRESLTSSTLLPTLSLRLLVTSPRTSRTARPLYQCSLIQDELHCQPVGKSAPAPGNAPRTSFLGIPLIQPNHSSLSTLASTTSHSKPSIWCPIPSPPNPNPQPTFPDPILTTKMKPKMDGVLTESPDALLSGSRTFNP